jgi:hypothetical protein
MRVLSLFDYTTAMVRPWADAGFVCDCVDIQHPSGIVSGFPRHPLVECVGTDIRTYLPPRVDIGIVFAFPPCTHLAVSGARWFQGKGLRALSESVELFARAAEIAEWTGAPYMIENPVSTISTYWRKPDFTFDPCDYAGYPGGENDTYTKKTCLWVGGGFVMPEPRRREPKDGSRMHLMAPSPERANLRSATPPGFARAVFEANHAALLEKAA